MNEESPTPKLHVETDFRSQVESERQSPSDAGAATPAESKLHVDSDWKDQARAEKERLATEELKKPSAGEPGSRELPPADFKTLVGVLATQAIMGLGTMADPQTGRRVIDLEGARFSIDLLGVLEEKSAGNLSDEEATEMTQVLSELRARFVQITQLVAQQGTEGIAGPGPAVPPTA